MIRFCKQFAVASCLLVGVGSAFAIQIKATVNGTANTVLGDLTATVGVSADPNFGSEAGTFTYDNATIGKLDHCYEMRWFQIVTSTGLNVRYGGAAAAFPNVDPPKGGWDYQAGSGGADAEPFYENSGAGAYAYPNYSARHTENVKSWTDDAPSAGPNGKKTVFQTWLVARKKGSNEFSLLEGYSWEVGRDNAGAAFGTRTGWIAPADADLATMNTALDNGAFDHTKWTIKTDLKLNCDAVPEPATWTALGLASLALARRSSRRRA